MPLLRSALPHFLSLQQYRGTDIILSANPVASALSNQASAIQCALSACQAPLSELSMLWHFTVGNQLPKQFSAGVTAPVLPVTVLALGT